jgi:Alpha-galactosidase
MFEKLKFFKVYYNVDGSGHIAEGENEHFSLKTVIEGNRFSLSILPKVKMELVHVEVSDEYVFGKDACVLPNGYQSWTMTKEYKKDERQKGLGWPCKLIKMVREAASIFGDYSFKAYPKEAGRFHGYTYGYVRNGNMFELIGSLSERNGYTIINFDMVGNRITVEKEVEGKTIDAEYKAFDFVCLSGGYDEVYDAYFKAMNIPAPRVSHTCGYTSWYNYFTKIDENIILRDLEGLTRVGDMTDIFQIDDGHQTKIGDWEITDTVKFPHGMKYIADKIHEKGFKAGIWLAPFYCQKDSKVALEHPDWLIKRPNGKSPIGFVGAGRPCEVLDIYNKDCAAYIKKFFKTVLSDWGYDMVKLDFLFAECLYPRNNKTRGEIMCDAMDFLRECVGDKLILGCGVPLGPSFGKVDFCRIGSDVDISFAPRWYLPPTNAEIVSTQTAIKNTIFRRGLNGRAFGNDPDVFLCVKSI